MIKSYLQKISAFVQKSESSYIRHNNELESSTALEKERKIAYTRLREDGINDSEIKIDELLYLHGEIKIAIDIGSGAGWGSAALSKKISTVFALEPSEAGINIAKEIFPMNEFGNIEWKQGFAEDLLPTLKLESPALFFTGCVLSHLRDIEVKKICKAVNNVAPENSILAFSECWGEKSWHQLMWHVRTKEWWQAQLPGWELTFHGPEIIDKDDYKGNYHKGFWGVKKR